MRLKQKPGPRPGNKKGREFFRDFHGLFSYAKAAWNPS
jgi:hypothetical protein